jgi:hypothetical protein
LLLAVPLVALPVLLVVLADLLVAQPELVLPDVLALPPRRRQLPTEGHSLQPMMLLSQGCTKSIPHDKLACWPWMFPTGKPIFHHGRHLPRRKANVCCGMRHSHGNLCKGKCGHRSRKP